MFEELRDQVQANFDQLLPRLKAAPAVDRTVPVKETDDGKAVRIITVDRSVDTGDEMILPTQSVEEIIDNQLSLHYRSGHLHGLRYLRIMVSDGRHPSQ